MPSHAIVLQKRQNEPFYLEAQIAVLKSAKAADCLTADWISSSKTENQSLFVGIELITAIIHSSDLSLRADGFSMVCENAKGTADFSPNELSLIKTCLKISIDTQVPSFGTSL